MSNNLQHRLTVTVFSDSQHTPIMFQVMIPTPLAKRLMGQAVTSVRLAVEAKPNIIADKTGLVDFR